MGPREIIIIALVVVLLFGAPKLPQLARAIGKSMRILKDETSSLTNDGAQSSPRSGDSTVDTSSVDDERRDQR